MSQTAKSAPRCVILDFDGTFTLVEVEAAPFENAYRAGLSDVIGRSVAEMWDEEAAHIRAQPNEFGWNIDGRIVAPATSDPYLFATAVAQRVFDRVGILKTRSLRAEVSQALYRESYKHTATAFKPEALEVIEGLLATGAQVFVVTNSHTEVVRRKLDELAPHLAAKVEVVGDAKKYVIDEAIPSDEVWSAVPESQSFPALPTRPVLLRRGRYYEALRRIWEKTGTGPAETIVCGDIYELDLALPAALGAQVHLVTGRTTLAFEREAMAQLGDRGAVSDSLRPLLHRVPRV